MDTTFILKDLLKDKQLALAILAQIIGDLKYSRDIKALLQSMLMQKFDQNEEILVLIQE